MKAAPESRSGNVAIFVMAFAVIAYQLLLTRIFSATLYYHYAFAGITLTFLGMTIGAGKVYLNPARFLPELLESEWAKAALGFAVSSAVFVLWFLSAPLLLPEATLMPVLSFSLLLFVIPFTYSGICITLLLTHGGAIGKLYAADLTGAALGCLSIVLLLSFLDPVSIVFLLAALCSWAAWRMVRESLPALAVRCRMLLCCMLAAGIVQGGLYLSGSPHLRVFWAKGIYSENIVFERWNIFSHVSVVPWPSQQPVGWGFGREPHQRIEQKYLSVDGGAGTMLYRFNGDPQSMAFLADDSINAAYLIRPVESAIVIGAGGGRDILSALYFGVGRITGLELNPSITRTLTHDFADFTGHLAGLPQVSLITAEARSWIAQHQPQADLIQLSLIDTWAATAAGGLTLTENRLYTLEAWEMFFKTLKPRGMLTVSRWYHPYIYPGEFYRLLSLAADSLKNLGVSSGELQNHILVFNVKNLVTLVASPTAFSRKEIAQTREMARSKRFALLVAPDMTRDPVARIITTGEATAAFYNQLPINVAASTDDRPFFFFTSRLADALRSETNFYSMETNNALMTLLILLLGTIAIMAAFIIGPLVYADVPLVLRDVWPDLVYFAIIGLGFTLIEISQMQRLMVFLGHPVFALSVVLFTLLLFGGLGSMTVREDASMQKPWMCPLSLCLILAATGLLMPPMMQGLASFGTAARILVSILLLAPSGFFMGMMFPAGIRMSGHRAELKAWFWGINGSMSVFASILGVLICLQYGIGAAYWTGVFAYLGCLLITCFNRPRVL